MKSLEIETPFGPKRRVSGWFAFGTVLLFPIVLLTWASLQPISLRENSLALLLSLNIYWIHGLTFLVLTCFIILVGKLRLGDLGLKANLIPQAAGTVGVAWLLAQVFLVCLMPLGYAEVQLNQLWTEAAADNILSFFANLLATGINEESFFRGFLFMQIYLLLSAKVASTRWNVKAFISATAISSLLFAFAHFRTDPADIAFLTFGGIVGVFIYSRTKNLFIGIGLHGLFNSPLAILECSPSVAKIVVLASLVIIAAAWPYIEATRTRRTI